MDWNREIEFSDLPSDADPEFGEPTRKARRTAKKEAAAAEKTAKAEARNAAKAAKVETKIATKVAKADAKEAAKQAKVDTKQAKVDAKEGAKQAKVDAKQAKVDAKEAAKQAKVDAREAAKRAKEDEKLEKAEAKVTAKVAKADAKEAAKQEKLDAKQATKRANEDAKLAKAEAKVAAKRAKEDAKLAKAEAKVTAKLEKKAAKAAKKSKSSEPVGSPLEADPEFGEPKLSRKARRVAKKEPAAAEKAAKVEAKQAAKLAKTEAKVAAKLEKKVAKAAKKGKTADPVGSPLEADPEFGEPKLSRKARRAANKDAAAAEKAAKVEAKKAAKSAPKAKKAKKAKKSRGSKHRELVGLKVGASQIAAARIVNNGDNQLVQVVREPLAPGIVTGGEVRDPTALGEALAGFFARHKLPKKGVRLGLANSRIGVRVIEVAGIDDERQLANAVGFRAHETLSMPLDEAVLDWQVLSEEADETGSVTRRILLVAVYRDSVDRYLAATDHAGIELVGIDLEAFALLRAISNPALQAVAPTEAAVVAVSVGHERTTLAISDGKVCEFTRVLEWGGSEVTAAIARALKISPLEAAELKHNLSFDQGVAVAEASSLSRPEQAVEAARFELQTLVRELLSSLRFYQAQPGSLAIGEILVSGGMAEMPGFAEELERQLGVRTRLADPLARVRLSGSLESPEKVGSLAVAIGLGIED